MTARKSLILMATALMISGTAFAQESGSRRPVSGEENQTEFEKNQKERSAAKIGERKKNDREVVHRPGRYDRRYRRQQQRLLQGVAKGEIDTEELTTLLAQQKRLEEMHKMAMADGKITREEAKILNNMQNVASGDIKTSRTPASLDPTTPEVAVDDPAVMEPIFVDPNAIPVVEAEPLLPEEPLVTPEDLTLGQYETINDQPRVFKGVK